ncbi:MAG: polynucleotide adenylyltransferase PcnB [Acidobacteriota bacterium]|nr:polynucleotide adenylyltransferase PcnB [Acidobacteriota bacterium]
MAESEKDPDSYDEFASAEILQRDQHEVTFSRISGDALKVLRRLDRAGYEACLVGGSVRDLMLGRRPKDFDVATDATPREVRRLFRNSRLIGRRFRLVHVFFHDSIVEVSTFRGPPRPDGEGDDLLVRDDNVFGSPEEDAFRRDFTVNALFYRICDQTVVDFVGGIEDLDEGLIRVIGEPDVRFQEDPVRMLRACEMAGRLGFEVEEEAQQAILRQREELAKASPARLIEELLALLRCTAAAPSFRWMWELGLAEVILPELGDMLDPELEASFPQLMPLVDKRVKKEDFSDSFLLAALLVSTVVHRLQQREEKLDRHLKRTELRRVVEEVVAGLRERFALSNIRTKHTEQTLFLFQRLCELPIGAPGAIRRVTQHSHFPEAVRLFELLVQATGQGQENLDGWLRAGKVAAAAPRGRRRSRPRRRRRS